MFKKSAIFSTSVSLVVIAIVVALWVNPSNTTAAGQPTINVNIASGYQTNTPSTFTVNHSESSIAVRLKVSFEDSSVADIASVRNSAGTALSLHQDGSSVVAYDSVKSSPAKVTVTFNTAKTYVLGFTIENAQTAEVLASVAYPISVGSRAMVLGATTFVITKDLTYGMQSEQVVALQSMLHVMGYFQGPVTGFYGKQTVAAVKAFQKDRNISQTGTVGPLTRHALEQM